MSQCGKGDPGQCRLCQSMLRAFGGVCNMYPFDTPSAKLRNMEREVLLKGHSGCFKQFKMLLQSLNAGAM